MMTPTKNLMLQEEMLLLLLNDKKGTYESSWVSYALGAAILSELLLADKLCLKENSKDKIAFVQCSDIPPNDPILAECFQEIVDEEKQKSGDHWVMKFAQKKNLANRIAEGLIDQDIIRMDKKKILFLFKQTIYPEVNPLPEKEIIERMRSIISGKQKTEARTAILIALCKHVHLLPVIFGKAFLSQNQHRIDRIGKDDQVAESARKAIEAMTAIIVAAIIVPTVINITT